MGKSFTKAESLRQCLASPAMPEKRFKVRSAQVREPDCSMSQRDAGRLVEGLIAKLRGSGFRRTAALTSLLTEMAVHHQPKTLAELGHLRSLAGRDQATIYRLMMKLEEAGAVRRFGFHGRASYFQLVIAGHDHDYLVCRSCGGMAEVEVQYPLEPVERELAARSGWQDVHHELEFFGVCPRCSDETSRSNE